MLNDIEVYYNYYKEKYIEPSVNKTIPGGFYSEVDSSFFIPSHWKTAVLVLKSNSEATDGDLAIARINWGSGGDNYYNEAEKSIICTNKVILKFLKKLQVKKSGPR